MRLHPEQNSGLFALAEFGARKGLWGALDLLKFENGFNDALGVQAGRGDGGRGGPLFFTLASTVVVKVDLSQVEARGGFRATGGHKDFQE